MKSVKNWEDGLRDIEAEIDEAIDEHVEAGKDLKEADSDARFEVIQKHKDQLRQWLNEIENELIRLSTEEPDRRPSDAEIERLEKLRDQINEHLKWA